MMEINCFRKKKYNKSLIGIEKTSLFLLSIRHTGIIFIIIKSENFMFHLIHELIK